MPTFANSGATNAKEARARVNAILYTRIAALEGRIAYLLQRGVKPNSARIAKLRNKVRSLDVQMRQMNLFRE